MSKSKSYSNPNSKARSRKEYNKKSKEKAYSNAQRSKKREDYKKHEDGKKPSGTSNNRVSYGNRKARVNKKGELIDVRTGEKIESKTYYKKDFKVKMPDTTKYSKARSVKDAAKIVVSSNTFSNLYIELPVKMNAFHKLSKQSKQLIVNFIRTNSSMLHMIEQKIYPDIKNVCYRKGKHHSDNILSEEFIWIEKYFCKEITKHNFNHRKYYHDTLSFKSNCEDTLYYRDLFFYKEKDKTTNKYNWFFVVNLSDLYDCYATWIKQENLCIPYSVGINHLIYKLISNEKETDATYDKDYHVKSRFAIVKACDNDKIKIPIAPEHKVMYMLYINNKNKRKAMEKESTDYNPDQFNKVVIKAIPVSPTHN